MKNRAIVVISAVPPEGSRITAGLRPAVNRAQHVPFPLYTGRLFGRMFVYAFSGPGKVNASHAATVLISRHAPALIVNLGVGGAYPSSGLAIGDVAVATKEVYPDEGVLGRGGLETFETIGMPLVRLGRRTWFNEFSTGNPWTNMAIKRNLPVIRERFPEFRIHSGPFATVSACTGTTRRAREIESRFGVICENMEGCAIAQICTIYQVPFIEIRGISNLVADRDRESWNIAAGAENCQSVALELLRELAAD